MPDRSMKQKVCPECNGSGREYRSGQVDPNLYTSQPVLVVCRNCKGSGIIAYTPEDLL
jgi:hypothetical protein